MTTELFIVAFGFLAAVSIVGCALTTLAARITPAPAPPRQYLAGRLDSVRISDAVATGDELLITLGLDPEVTLSAEAFRIPPGRRTEPRVTRWREKTTSLRCYFSDDDSIMLIDPVLGCAVAAEPVRALNDASPKEQLWLTSHGGDAAKDGEH